MKKTLIIFFLLGFVAVFAYFYIRTQNISLPVVSTNSPIAKDEFSLDLPPKESLSGEIVTMTGDIFWESRVASTPALIVKPVPVEQGEDIQTGDNGKTKIDFPKGVSVTMSPQSEISFVQTLPKNFVFEQKSGQSSYITQGEVPLSIRISHLLILLSNGQMDVSIDKLTGKINASVKKGEAKAGYNDRQNVSQVETISFGKTFTFNDETRESEIN